VISAGQSAFFFNGLLEVNLRVAVQRDQPRCEPCHTQSETDLNGPVIFRH
jgi:hypothetical protein